jgi:hypothetical protein
MRHFDSKLPAQLNNSRYAFNPPSRHDVDKQALPSNTHATPAARPTPHAPLQRGTSSADDACLQRCPTTARPSGDRQHCHPLTTTHAVRSSPYPAFNAAPSGRWISPRTYRTRKQLDGISMSTIHQQRERDL